MPAVAGTNDIVTGLCNHGLPCCPHAVVGYHGPGSGNVRAEGKGVQRDGDIGVHTCPHCGVFMCVGHSGTVRANGKGVFRKGDMVTHFCGAGIGVTAVATVKVNGA